MAEVRSSTVRVMVEVRVGGRVGDGVKVNGPELAVVEV